MDRRRVELQIRAVLVTYRVEAGRQDARTMEQFRETAHALLDGLDQAVGPYPDLEEQLEKARREVEAEPPRPAEDVGTAAAP